MIKITFPDGSVKEFARGTTAYQVAESISPRLAADSLAASVNGATVDMMRPIETDAAVLELDCQPRHAAHLFGNGDGMGVHLMYKFVGKCQVDNGIRILIPVIIIPIS